MGLDQYLFARNKTPAEKPEEDDSREELGYWRKNPDLHGYIEALWRGQNPGAIENFNCVDYVLAEEDMNAIIECCKKKSFGEHDGTTGFFFGQTHEEDYADTIEIMEKGLEALRSGKEVYYTSWW